MLSWKPYPACYLGRVFSGGERSIGVEALGSIICHFLRCPPTTHPMRALIAQAGVLAALAATGSGAAEPLLTPGLYQVDVRIALPNVQDAATPLVLTRCVTPSDIQSGQAFFVLSDNPLKNCPLIDYEDAGDTAIYRIECPGPNMGSAVGVFEITRAAYRGTIKMNMGGKNMTMSETQVGRRIGDCR